MPPRLWNVVLALGAWLGFTGSACAGAFTPGNLVVLVNSNAKAANNSAVGINLAEYTTSGSLVQTITVSSSGTTGNRLTQSVSGVNEGYLSRSGDGQYLTFAGYDADAGTASVKTTLTTGAGAVLRVVGKADSSGTVTFGTNTTSYSGDSFSSATTADGSRYWTASDAAAVDHGLRTIANGATNVAAAKVNETEKVLSAQVFNNQLYGSTSTTIFQTNTALPTGESATTNLVSDLKGASGFVLLDRINNDGILDTMYIASQTDGLLKYTFNGTSWVTPTAFKNDKEGGLNSVVGLATGGGSVDLYVTGGNGTNAGNRLLKLTDDGSDFSLLNFSLLAVAPGDTAFRSVQVGPTASVPEPASLVLVGLVVAGGVAFRLRRRWTN